MKAGHVVLLMTTVCSAVACGEDERPPKQTPSPAAVRAYHGLTPGSCFLYRVDDPVGTVLAAVEVTGPNTTVVAGRSVYVKTYRRLAGGLPTEDDLDTEENGELRLLRHVDGPPTARVTRRYEDGGAPLFARLAFDRAGALMLDGARFETSATPRDMPVERHVWSVLQTEKAAATPDGTTTAVELLYERGSGETSTYDLVPGFGIARFTDFSGINHQVCAARVCDDQGTCSGADSCTALSGCSS